MNSPDLPGKNPIHPDLAAIVLAATRLASLPRKAGIVLVFTAGEETRCEGAHHLAAQPGVLGEAGAIVIGEPTANRPLVGHKGLVRYLVRTTGVTAHASMPEEGDNAIHKIAEVVQRLEGGERPLIDRVLSVLEPLFSEIILVSGRAKPLESLGFPIVLDTHPGSGPLGGLVAALEAIEASRGFLVGCDMPHLDPDLIRFLAEIGTDAAATVPGKPDRLQPLHAFYRKEVAGPAQSVLDEGRPSMRDLLDRISWHRIDPQEFAHLPGSTRSFINVNTQEDLALLRTEEARS